MQDNIEFPTYNEAEEYCRDNNLSYDVIEYSGDYATININMNISTITNNAECVCKQLNDYEVHYINSDDMSAYAVIKDVANKEQAIQELKKRFKKEIYRIVGVLQI